MTKQIIPASNYGLNQQIIDQDALQVIKKLQNHGYSAYIVGGGVRDLLLGKTPKDYDLVTSAEPEKIRQIFGRNSMIIGRRFKIVHVYYERINKERSERVGKVWRERHILEVSTFRSNTTPAHAISEHGRILVDNNYGTIDQDAYRRDFTVNALYYDPLAEVIIDYHGGLNDIEHKLLRIIGNPYERYLEDPVRVLRAIRLSEKLGLTIDENTYINFRNVKHLLLNEPKGRLFEEMLKILTSGNTLSILRELYELKLPRKIFPLFDKLFFVPHPDEFAVKVLERTDARLLKDEDVSLIFILAGMMWPPIYQSWQEELTINTHPRQALMDAIAKNKDIIFNSGISQNLYSAIREVWMLQIEFDLPSIARLDHVPSNGRFRQAWHLFHLRNEFNEVDPVLFAWWERFMVANEDSRTELLIELVDIAPPEYKKQKRKTKKNRKRKSHRRSNHQDSTNF